MKITQMSLRKIIREVLLSELLSPVGSSVNEIISNIDEIVMALEDIAGDAECTIKDRIKILDCVRIIKNSTSVDGRKMSAALTTVISVLEVIENEDAKNLILRLQTLVRRDLPVSGIYDSPQSGLNSSFNPAKSTKFGPTP